MQKIHTPKTGEGARVSRRKFMAFAASGAAATLPAVAMAGVSEKAGRLPRTLHQKFDDCVAQLREILTEMHPNATKVHDPYLRSAPDGSFLFSFQGDVQFQDYQGDGIYLVSLQGYPFEFLVREERVISLSGRDLGWSRYYGRMRRDDGSFMDDERDVHAFIRKLGEVPLNA